MSRLQIDKNNSRFILEGQPFFYLADTIWSAFTNITIEEWKYYLKKRKRQGFNVLQINTLPQWDRCMSDVGIYPFATKDGQQFDFSCWNEEYYQRAGLMCEMAVKEGFQLALVVLWLNYVPGTWGSRMFDGNVFPQNFIEEYTNKIAEVFDKYDPIYVVSGDTDFDTLIAISYYRTALEVLCRKSPDTLKTFHIKRGYDIIPEEFLDKIDFYMFQSGHNAMGQDMTYILPGSFKEKYPKKPIINAEPCYEQMGFSREEYGRFQSKDIRKAAWSSILSGADAGITYGAHGIWNWNKIGSPKNPILGEGFDKPFSWQEALEFPGAWDYGFIKFLMEEFHVKNLVPANHLLANCTDKIRLAVSDDKYFIYAEYSTSIKLLKSFEGYKVVAFDLQTRRIAWLEMKVNDEESIIEMHPFYQDVLLILKK